MTYADYCIERAENAKLRSDDHGHNTDVLREYCENELIYAYDITVPELARRLKQACIALRDADKFTGNFGRRRLRTIGNFVRLRDIADELEAMPEVIHDKIPSQ